MRRQRAGCATALVDTIPCIIVVLAHHAHPVTRCNPLSDLCCLCHFRLASVSDVRYLKGVRYPVNKGCRFSFEVQMISDVAISPRMGRPPLNRDDTTKRTQVRFEDGMLKRIDKLVGAHRRSIFIREAVEEKLTAVEAELARRKS
jgi:hypothetical protein